MFTTEDLHFVPDAAPAAREAQLHLAHPVIGEGEPGVFERWRVERRGEALLDVVLGDFESGAVFRAGSDVVVGAVVQGGFACNDLLRWGWLAAAAAPPDATVAGISWEIGIDTGIRLAAPSASVLERSSFQVLLTEETTVQEELWSSWRGLALAIAPWDTDGALRKLLLGASDGRVKGAKMAYGPAPWTPAAEVPALDDALRAVPVAEALARADKVLAGLEDADAWTEADYLRMFERWRRVTGEARRPRWWHLPVGGLTPKFARSTPKGLHFPMLLLAQASNRCAAITRTRPRYRRRN
jgi:hypothetical protein